MSNVRLNTAELGGLTDAPAAPERAGKGFASALENAVGEVEALEGAADAQAAQLARGGGNLHETALALEKADVAMRVMVKVRNKLVDAYNEVMRMSI